MKSVATFYSYREFLRAAYDEAKAASPQLSLTKYAQHLGLNSSTLKMILTGKRNLTASRIHDLAQRLKLSTTEAEYFEALVLKEQSKGIREANYYSKRATEAKTKIKLRSISFSKTELLSDPLVLPLLVYLTDFEEPLSDENMALEKRATHLSKLFRADPIRIEKILRLLSSSGIMEKKTSAGEIHYSFSQLNHILNQKKYLKKWLEESTKYLDSEYSDKRTLFNASTISISPSKLVELKTEIKAILEKHMSEPPSTDEKMMIVQACFQIFPVFKQ